MGADLLEFAVLQVADVVSGRKNFKTAVKNVERQSLGKKLEREGKREAFQSKIWSKAVGHAETFLLTSQFNNDRSK